MSCHGTLPVGDRQLRFGQCGHRQVRGSSGVPFATGRPVITRKRQCVGRRRPHGSRQTAATYTADKEVTKQNLPTEFFPAETPAPLNWEKQWYPLHAIEDLDPAKPHSMTLLGKNLVLWNDKTQWKAFLDICPHRMVPLSEGRVHDGTLECAYHGWEFDGSGKPVVIPQIGHSDKKAEQYACQNSRACCQTFPTQVRQGLIWVWADSSPQAHIESSMQAPTLSPEYGRHENEDWAWTYQHYVRDVPGSFEFWMENMMDQSHVPFSHSGVAADRHFKEDAEIFQYVGVDKRQEPQEGFEFKYKVNFNSSFGLSAQNVEFKPPTLCRFSTENSKKSGFSLWIYAVPITSNSTRLIINAGLSPKAFAQSTAAAAKNKKSPVDAAKTAAIRAFSKAKPRWQSHMQLSGITDGDAVFLHRQSSYAKEHAKGQPSTQYYMPSPSDRGVSAWYQWLDKRGGGGPKYEGQTQPALFQNDMGNVERRVLLDRINHVRNCASCTKALQNTQKLQEVAKFTGIAAFLGTAYLLGQGSDTVSVPAAASLALGAASVVASKKLQQLEKHFGFLDWDHSEH